MTWYLPEADAANPPDRPGQTAPVPSWSESFAAQFKLNRLPSRVGGASWGQGVTSDYLDQMERQAGISGSVPPAIQPRGGHAIPVVNPEDWRKARLLSTVTAARKEDHHALAGLPGTPEEFDAALGRQIKAQQDELNATLANQPNDQWGARTAAGLAEFATRPSSVLALPLNLFAGPEVGLARMAAGQALIGAGQGTLDVADQNAMRAKTGDAPMMTGESALAVGEAAGINAVLGVGLHLLPPAVMKLVTGARSAADRAPAIRAAADYLTGRAKPDGTTPLQGRAQIDGAAANLTGDTASGAALRPNPQLAAEADPAIDNLLSFVGRLEAPQGYDQAYSGIVVVPPKPLTQMTVDEVLAWQQANTAAGARSSAAGQFQIIKGTLSDLKAEMGLNGTELFDPTLQKRMAVQLMRRHGLDAWRAGQLSDTEFGNRLAQEWASLPVMDGQNAGRSFYAGDGLNNALTNTDAFGRVLGGDVADAVLGADAAPRFTGYRTSRGYTQEGQVSVGDNMRINVQYEVVDAASLIRASGDLQPRDRTRIASDAWIADTAARLDPARLMPSPDASTGAPIVGPDNIIESGNGRFAAIQRAYAEHPDRAAAYRQQIEAAGYKIPEGVQTPVLVARRTSELTHPQRVQMVVDAQNSGVAAMTPTEVASAAAKRMTPERMAGFDPAKPMTDPANAIWLKGALETVPASARNAMFEATGGLNKLGQMNMKAALFARAWSDADILARYAETDAGAMKSLLDGLEISAPYFATLKAEIEAGRVRPEMDISGFVMDAVRTIAAARDIAARDGIPVDAALNDLLAQADMLTGATSPLTEALTRKFWNDGNVLPAKTIGGFLTRYAEEARKSGATDTMLAATAQDILKAVDPKGFADLPADLGQPRSVMPAADPVDATPIRTEFPQEGYDKGAASPEAEQGDALLKEQLSTAPAPEPAAPGSIEELQALIAQGAPRAELDNHPAVIKALEEMKARPQTDLAPGYNSAEWHTNRLYKMDGQEIRGTVNAMAAWEKQADELAWRETGQVPVPVKRHRELVIVLGPPAAGKSTIANDIAIARGAAIIDSDEIKKSLPEFDGGVGASAVHEESSALTKDLQSVMIHRGTNVVLPKVGETFASIEKVIALYRKGGYRVSVVNMAVTPENAYRRMIGRFAATGRIIPPEYLDMVGSKPSLTYHELKIKGAADGYAEIDNNGAFGQPQRITDRAGENALGNTRYDVQPGGNQRPGAVQGLIPPALPKEPWADLVIRTDEKSPGVHLSDLMADIEEDMRLADVIEACNPKGAA
jgi:predicted kinase